uniref:Protein kinase domain-containing protein n=1 Tax=Tetradesmus obliquus TaxID=3088 RepID=A0A383V6A6_TETOB|eukprot:jgi/Sobl393_1/12899/SZX61137.1
MQHQGQAAARAGGQASWHGQQQHPTSTAQPQQRAAGQQQLQQAAAGGHHHHHHHHHHAHVVPGSAAPASGDAGSWGLEQRYDLLGKIGEGTYGVVYLATSKQDKKRVYAIKKFKTGREGDGISPTAIREILLLRELDHEHIVKLTAVHINRSEPSLSLAFEYAEHDMYEIIWHHRDRLAGPIDPYVVKSLMWQLLNGLSYLHQNWIIHRDLKPSNVLVMGEGPEAGVVKVADFGLARFFQAGVVKVADFGLARFFQAGVVKVADFGLARFFQLYVLEAGVVKVADFGLARFFQAVVEASVVKVADFGLARFFQAPLRPLSDNGVVVTIWYRPPELLLGGRHYTRAVDMWGAGCIFAELLTLRPLFQGQERKQPGAPFQLDQLERIFRVLGQPSPLAWPHLEQLPHWANNTENIRVKRPEWGANRLEAHLGDVMRHLGEAFARAGAAAAAAGAGGRAQQPLQLPKLTAAGINLLQEMLAYDPLKRISAEAALHHPYFQEEPRPGPNAFVCNGRRVASYPRRHKQTVFPGTTTAPAAVGAAAGAAQDAAAADGQQQQQPAAGVTQQQRSQAQQQQQQQRGQAAGQQQRQQQQHSRAPAAGQSRHAAEQGSQQQQKKRNAESQGRKGDGYRSSGSGRDRYGR